MIFCLCNGEQSRYEANGPKQLVEVGDIPLLARTAMQTAKLGQVMTVVTHNEMIKEFCSSTFLVHLEPIRPTENLCRTILQTSEWWEDNNIFLLGDVYYSNFIIEKILDDKSAIRFYGDHIELYGFVINGRDRMRLLSELTVTAIGSPGKMWHLLRLIAEHPFNYHNPDEISSDLLYRVKDITCDIDTPEDYNKLLDLLGGQSK